MRKAKRTKQTVLAIELDGDELACRILEGLSGQFRRPGTSAVEGLKLQEEDVRAAAIRAASQAILYFEEAGNGRLSVLPPRGHRCEH